MAELSVSALITNYNTWKLSLLCAQKCVEMEGGNLKQILVYDDCSPEPMTVEFPPQVTLVRAPENTGLSKALNRAYALAEGDVIVQFDADAYPTAPFADELRTLFAADPGLGLVAFRTTGSRGQTTESFMTEPNLWGLLLGQALFARLERWLGDKSGRVSVTMCAMGVRKAAFDEIGGFDEKLGFLDIDHDFSMRMNRSRWRVAISDRLKAFHEGGGTKTRARKRLLLFYQPRWHLLMKFGKIRSRRLAKALILLRLLVELGVLKAAGRWLYADAETRFDKVQGRKDLIHYCSHNY